MKPESPPTPAILAVSPADALLRWAERYRWWIFGGIAVLYLAGFNGQWRIGPDTALYAIVGRSVAEGTGFAHPLGEQAELTPGLPWLIAACFKLFGSGNFFAVQVVMWLMSVATLALFYHLIKLNAGRPAAVAITYMLAVTERFYRYAFELMADLPFLFGVMLFLVGYERIWHGRDKRIWTWLGMTAGIVTMALSRSVVLVFVAGLAIAAVWHGLRGPHRWKHAMVLAIAIGGVLASRAIDPRVSDPLQLTSDERIAQQTFSTGALDLLSRIVTHNLPEMFEGAAPEALFGVELGPALNTLVALLVIGLGLSLVLHRVLWAVLVAAFIGQMVLFYFVVPRYFLPILPLLIAAGWLGANGLNRRMRQPLGGWLAILLTFAWTVPNLVKVGATIIEQRRPDFYAHYEEGEFAGIDRLGEQVQDLTEPHAWLLIRDGSWRQPLTFFTRRRVAPLQRFGELSPTDDVIYYVEQGMRRFPKRVTTRRQWRFSDPLVIVGRTPGSDPWTLRRVTYRPTTQPATTAEAP